MLRSALITLALARNNLFSHSYSLLSQFYQNAFD